MQGTRFFRFLGTVLIILFASWAGFGCQQAGEKQSNVNLSWDIEPDPPRVGMSTITIVLQDSTHRPVEDARVTLEGNMSHPGMQPVISQAIETEPGRYSAKMEFTMAGDWFILITTTLEDSTIAEHQIELPRVRPQ